MPSLLNPYRDFFHCAGEEFQYEMDVANEVVDYPQSFASTSNSSRRYTPPSVAAGVVASTPARRLVGGETCPPSPASSVEEFRTESPPRHIRKASRS